MTDISKETVKSMSVESTESGLMGLVRSQEIRIEELEAQNAALISERSGIIATKREQLARKEPNT